MPASLSGVIINEIQLGNAFASGLIDANGDGSADGFDEAVELFNDGGSSVLLTGWELWYVQNNVTGNSAELIATLNPAIIPPGGYYTVVSSTPQFVDTSNVGAGEEADIELSGSTGATYALYDPNSNQYILVGGAAGTGVSETTLVNALVAAHPLATQSGTTEIYPERTGDGPATVQRETNGSDTWEVNSATLGQANCFARGTLITTPNGEQPIETLEIGDLVRTDEGYAVPVKWIGRQTIEKHFWRGRAQLVRIAAGALGNHSDLYVTGDHGMVLDGFIINASALVNGSTIDWVPLTETPERQTVYHVEIETHDVILANGAPSETYLDIPGRHAFDNFREYIELYGSESSVPESKLARITSRRLLPAHVRTDPSGLMLHALEKAPSEAKKPWFSCLDALAPAANRPNLDH